MLGAILPALSLILGLIDAVRRGLRLAASAALVVIGLWGIYHAWDDEE